MANSASDAGGSEREIRRKLIETGAVDWDRRGGPEHVLHGDPAGHLVVLRPRQGEGQHAWRSGAVRGRTTPLPADGPGLNRVFDPDHIEFLANIVRLWRGEPTEEDAGSGARMAEAFPDGAYRDVPGLCRVAARADIAAQDWSLNPGRYVGFAPGQQHDGEEFRVKLEALQEELEKLNVEAAQLQAQIAQNVADVLSI